MAYDLELAERVRDLMEGVADVREKAMFGGLAFLVDGHMALAVSGRGGLMVRVGAEGEDEALDRPNTSVVVMRGRPMTGWVRVANEGVGSRAELDWWLTRAVALTRGLPPKR
jgi:TfoX/Sxy family transcriptional regulator of competence genes